MVEFWEWKYRIQKFYTFSQNEILQLVASVLVIAFIWGFDDGGATFNLTHWILNYISIVIMAAIAFFTQISIQKCVGIYHGFKVEYRVWSVGLVLGVIVAFLTRGHFPLMLAGGMSIVHLSRLRIGEFRYGLNTFESGISALWGPLSNIILVMLLKAVIWQILGIDWPWLNEFFIFSTAFAVYSMLPIPPLYGVIIFYGSKLLYIFGFAAILAYILLIIIFGFYSLIWAVILGLIMWWVYWWFVEK